MIKEEEGLGSERETASCLARAALPLVRGAIPSIYKSLVKFI